MPLTTAFAPLVPDRARKFGASLTISSQHVAIIDFRLPDLLGIEVVKAIRNAKLKACLIVYSDYAGAEHIRAAMEAGASALVTKDSVAELPAAIRRVLPHADPRFDRQAKGAQRIEPTRAGCPRTICFRFRRS